MDTQELKPGDKVVLKNNNKIIYILLSIEGDKAVCLNPNNEKTELYLIAIQKYTPPAAVRFRSIG